MQRQRDDQSQTESDYVGLQPVGKAVLWRLANQAQRYRRYDADALRCYQHQTGKTAIAPRAQNALESLRQHNPTRLRRSARGEYVVDDAAMHEWYQKCVADQRWPAVAAKGERR